MDTYQEIFSDQNFYDDGIVVDYATMIRMWSTLDRSVTAFNRRCGVLKPSSRDIARLTSDGRKESRSK